jgi:uncharacterized protein YcbK (DUF882 family)
MLTVENLRRPNFKPEDFVKSNTAEQKGIDNTPNQNHLIAGMVLANKMQELRDKINLPIIISSGFRCSELNKAIGGAPNSLHMQFLACDFNIKGLDPYVTLLKIKESLVSVDKCFVERNCVHIQIRMDESKNRNFFGTATKVNGKWVVTSNF